VQVFRRVSDTPHSISVAPFLYKKGEASTNIKEVTDHMPCHRRGIKYFDGNMTFGVWMTIVILRMLRPWSQLYDHRDNTIASTSSSADAFAYNGVTMMGF
jgi:hypothetical protein